MLMKFKKNIIICDQKENFQNTETLIFDMTRLKRMRTNKKEFQIENCMQNVKWILLCIVLIHLFRYVNQNVDEH